MQPYDNSALPKENSWRLPSNFQPSKSGGAISLDTVEQLRNEGVSNKSIASYMAGSSKGFQQHYGNVIKSYGDTEEAAKSYLNYRFYGDVNYQKPTPEEKNKGIMSFPVRVIDNVWEGWKRSAMEMGKIEEKAEAGEISNANQYAQQYGQSAHAVGKALAAPWTEAFDTKAFNIAPSVTDIATPIVQSVAEPIMKSKFAQEVAIPAGQKYMEYSEQSPTLQSVNQLAVGGGSLAAGIMGINPMMSGSRTLASAMRHPITTATQTIPTQTGKGLGAILNIPKSAYSGVKQGLGYGKAAPGTAGQQLGGKTAEFVKKGGNQLFANDVATMNEAERLLAKRMTLAAEKAARTTLKGTKIPKTIAGEQLLAPAKHIIEHKKAVGKALGNVADAMAGEAVDFTDDAAQVFQAMSDKGVVFSRESGKIIGAAGVPDSELHLLQKLASFFQPDDTGRVIRDFREAHLFRSKIFKEIDAAKAALSPTAQGQSVFDISETMADQARGMMIKRMSGVNPSYGVYSGAYKDLTSQAAPFYKFIGYKGVLDDIDVHGLGTGEASMLTLGSRSADKIKAIDDMIALAEKYGYQSSVDPRKLIDYVSALDNIYPLQAPEALAGQIRKGLGASDLSAPKRAGIKAVINKIDDAYQHFRGMTLENRTRLLLELLDEPPNASLVTVAEKVLPRADYAQFMDDVSRDVKVGDVDVSALSIGVMDDAAGGHLANPSLTTLPETLKSVNKDFPGLTLDEIASLTPEERATGIIGGGGDDMPRIPSNIKNGDVIDLPLSKIDTLSLEPKPRPFPETHRKIVDPIEVTVSKDGQVTLDAGNHRYHQAMFNGDQSIPAKIRFENGATSNSLTSGVQSIDDLAKQYGGVDDIPLAKEARKYKSAEEFVKEEGSKLYIHGSPKKIEGGLKLNSKALGVQQPEKNAVDVLYVTPNTETGQMHSRMYTKQSGATYAVKLKPHIKIFDYTNPEHRAMIDKTMTHTQKKLVTDNLIDGQLSWMATPPVKNVKNLGFDGMKQIERKAGERSFSPTFGDAIYPEHAESLMLFNKNVFEQVDIPTIKSQLTDIWNKANPKSK